MLSTSKIVAPALAVAASLCLGAGVAYANANSSITITGDATAINGTANACTATVATSFSNGQTASASINVAGCSASYPTALATDPYQASIVEALGTYKVFVSFANGDEEMAYGEVPGWVSTTHTTTTSTVTTPGTSHGAAPAQAQGCSDRYVHAGTLFTLPKGASSVPLWKKAKSKPSKKLPRSGRPRRDTIAPELNRGVGTEGAVLTFHYAPSTFEISDIGNKLNVANRTATQEFYGLGAGYRVASRADTYWLNNQALCGVAVSTNPTVPVPANLVPYVGRYYFRQFAPTVWGFQAWMTIGPTQEKVVTMQWIVKVQGGFIMPMGYILARGWAEKEYQPNAEVLKILENITGSVEHG